MSILSGSLEFVSLSRLLSFAARLRADGHLVIADGSLSGTLFVEDGKLVGAAFGNIHGTAALDAIALLLDHGSFSLSADAIDEQMSNLSLDPDALQQRLEQLSDMRARLAPLIPSPWSLPVATDLAASSADSVTVDRSDLKVLLACNGRRTVADLALAHGLHSTIEALARLIGLGLVECRQTRDALATSALPEGTLAGADGGHHLGPERRGLAAPRRQPSAQGGWGKWRGRPNRTV